MKKKVTKQNRPDWRKQPASIKQINYLCAKYKINRHEIKSINKGQASRLIDKCQQLEAEGKNILDIEWMQYIKEPQEMIADAHSKSKKKSTKTSSSGKSISIMGKYCEIHIANRLKYLLDGVRIKGYRTVRVEEVAFVAARLMNKVMTRMNEDGSNAAIVTYDYFNNDGVKADYKENTGMSLTYDKLVTIYDVVDKLGILKRKLSRQQLEKAMKSGEKVEQDKVVMKGKYIVTKYPPTIWTYSGWLKDDNIFEAKKKALSLGLEVSKVYREERKDTIRGAVK